MTNARRLRPVDLARSAGVSTQQIRNYEDAGVLPPADRTASGYRAFTEVHRGALLAYRTLMRGYGPVAATRIMRTLHEGDVAGALALVDAAHAALHEERVSLRAASEALELLAAEPPPRSPGPAGCASGRWPRCWAYGPPRYGCGRRPGCSRPGASAARVTGSTNRPTCGTPGSCTPCAAVTICSTRSGPCWRG